MKGYRKISDDYIEVTIDDITGGDLENNIIPHVNHAVTSPILDHAEKTHVLEYKVVIYAKKV
jgi:hypothetical protein